MAHPGLHLIPRHMGSAIDDLLDADEGDCLLAMTVRPYSSDTIRSMRFAREKGARIILISDSEVIAPGIQADVTFRSARDPCITFPASLARWPCWNACWATSLPLAEKTHVNASKRTKKRVKTLARIGNRQRHPSCAASKTPALGRGFISSLHRGFHSALRHHPNQMSTIGFTAMQITDHVHRVDLQAC